MSSPCWSPSVRPEGCAEPVGAPLPCTELVGALFPPALPGPAAPQVAEGGCRAPRQTQALLFLFRC